MLLRSPERARAIRSYHLPLAGQPFLPTGVHLRSTSPVDFRRIVYFSPVFDSD
jgi:hypothetical protein